ncbi:ATP-dependent helicase [Candidatus Saccharibacteria bacterium]|nr:ATP-dependent helicase [Candidatus Saccharibacteria bacterium]
MSKFEESLKQLNTEQRKAVDQIDGPVMVIAGPGTGKTQLLSMRVANILNKTDTDPSSILCLTFTNKAAINMRQRIIELTAGSAKSVNVKTFHSFAMEIMNIYPEYFWNGAELITAPEASQLEIITNILKKLPLDNPLSLKFAGRFTSDKKVKQALKLVKEAGLTPDQLRSIIEANIAYLNIIETELCKILDKPLSLKSLDDLMTQIEELPEQGIADSLLPLQDMGTVIKSKFSHSVKLDKQLGKTYNTGELKKKMRTVVDGQPQMLRERKANDWWLKLADVYQLYRAELHGRGYYDHSDMIIEVLTALQKYPDLKAIAQEKYLYVLIDEFQDTNAAQLQLAHQIADHPSANGNPNLMIVGDDDQTIYKFNGADLNNMLSFEKSYPKTKKIVLTRNYRSTQDIITASEKIINNAQDRLVSRDPSISKKLVSNIENQKSNLESRLYLNEQQQLYDIALDIKENHKKFSAGTKGKSIAVLARGHQSLKQIAKRLDDQKIPINYELKNNIFDLDIIQLIHKISGLVVSINAGNIRNTNFLLSEVIKHPVWGIKPKTLWQIAIDNYQKANWLNYLTSQKDDQSDLAQLGNWFLWLASESTRQPLPVIMEYIIGMRASPDFQSPIRAYFLEDKKDTEYLKSLSAINIIYGLTKEFSKLHTIRLADFYDFINVNLENNIIVSDDLVFSSGNNAVQLLTIHKAKGLEFDRVYIIDAQDKIWKPKAGSTYTPLNLPLQPVFDDQDDYARLMYVAATRAKQDIIFSSYAKDETDREVLTTPLLYEVAKQTDKTKQVPSNLVEMLEDTISWPNLNTKDIKKLLSPKVEDYSLSASALLSFLDLSYGGPQAFIENYLLRLPQPQTESEAFGSAIHRALEIAQIQVNTSGLNKGKLIEKFSQTLNDQFLPADEVSRYQEKGTNLLNKLLDSPAFTLKEGGKPELNLENIRIEQATIKGKLDNTLVNKNQITIIDYKTGNPLSSLFTKDQSKVIKAWRHRTQLTFYSLLIKNSNLYKPNMSILGQMYYLEADSDKNIIKEYQPTNEEIESLAKLSAIVWQKIKSLDFPDVSQYSPDFEGISHFQQDLLNGRI